MSTYKQIRGLKVRDYTTNPDNPIEGQLWYNKTDQVGKYQIPNLLASWRTSVSMNTARNFPMGAGTTTSALASTGVPNMTNVESWNGSAWTETTDVSSARQAGFGSGESNTAAIIAGGENPGGNTGLAEQWNGSSWAEKGDLNTPRRLWCSGGPSTLSIVMGGYTTQTLEIQKLLMELLGQRNY